MLRKDETQQALQRVLRMHVRNDRELLSTLWERYVKPHAYTGEGGKLHAADLVKEYLIRRTQQILPYDSLAFAAVTAFLLQVDWVDLVEDVVRQFEANPESVEWPQKGVDWSEVSPYLDPPQKSPENEYEPGPRSELPPKIRGDKTLPEDPFVLKIEPLLKADDLGD